MPGTTLAAVRGGGDHDVMRYESPVTSVSWIPSEAVEGIVRYGFDAGVGHYDSPLPDTLADVEEWRAADRSRFANQLPAWMEVDGSGRITGCGYGDGGGVIGSTTVRLGRLRYCFQAVGLPDLRTEPERGEGWVRFAQTAGGRVGMPMPRRVRRRPHVQWNSALGWTPHPPGQLFCKSGLTDFRGWYRTSFGRHSPWGDQDSPALVTMMEPALPGRADARRHQTADPPRLARYRACPPGGAWHRDPPPPRRGGADRAGRRAAGRIWTRRDARRARWTRGGARTSSVMPSRHAGSHRPTPASSTRPRWRNWPVATSAKARPNAHHCVGDRG